MPVPTHLPHILYSTVLTSVSIHLLWQRRASEDERARKHAQITILEDLAHQLRSGTPITDDAVDKLRKLAHVHSTQDPREGTAEGHGVQERKVRWTDVLWGNKVVDQKGTDEWERKDLDQIRREFTKAAS